MGIVLAVLLAIATIVFCLMLSVAHADGQPPMMPITPVFVAGMVIAALLLISHFHHLGW